MTNFETWDRATLEQFAREARDKLVEMAQAEPVAWLVTSKRGFIRACWTDKPSEGQIAGADYDGDTITPLYTSAPSIPEGWQLVPKEPTEEWCEKFGRRTIKRWPMSELKREVLEMLAAAPKHTPNKEQA